MTRLVHLTDLHFGFHREDLVAPLAQAVRDVTPDLVVVSGDLTHRARVGQFRQARAFLDGLGVGYIAMPGNHDMPLFNLPLRLFSPFMPWRRIMGQNLAEDWVGPEVQVIAANTADPFQWRRGYLRPEDVRRLRGRLQSCPEDQMTVLACHHPVMEPPGFDRGETRGAAKALPLLAEAGLGIVLSGHLHCWETGVGMAQMGPQPVLIVQTGTALCARVGEVDHGFSVLDLGGSEVKITKWIVDEPSKTFRAQSTLGFHRANGLWRALLPTAPS